MIAKNDENGLSTKKVKFKTEGEFVYKIREAQATCQVDLWENDVTATVKVTDKAGAKTARDLWPRSLQLTYMYQQPALVVKA